MENRLQATFMPRQPVAAGGDYVRPKRPPGFFMIIGVLAFVLSLLAMGGLFAYKSFVTGSNGKKQAKVEEAIKNFEPELTRELTVIKTRMDAGKNLLENHPAPSLLFTLLELNTSQTVQFKELSYSVSPEGKIKLTLKGEARSYNAIAFQSDVFSKVEQLKNPVFSNLTLDEQGVISFDFNADLDPSAVAYKKLTSGLAPSPASVVSTTTAASTTSPALNVTTGAGASSTLKLPGT